MSRRHAPNARQGSIAAGSLLLDCVATPAFGAAFDAPFTVREPFLMGSPVLLAAWVRRMGRRLRDADVTPNAPDRRSRTVREA